MSKDLFDMPERWTVAWSSSDSKAWLNLYAPSATYTDHAFRVSRTGHELLAKHHDLWRTSNPNFVVTIDPEARVWWRDVDEEKGNGQCSMRTINKGTFVKTLVTKQPSGRSWEFRAVVDLVIENGLIVRVDEYYTSEFDLSGPLSVYRTA